MADLVRTGVSLERQLLARFDKLIARKGYRNRSKAIRDVIRDQIIDEEADENKIVAGTLTMVYDHHRRNLSERLIEVQHHAASKVLAATHVHLSNDYCLEVVIMKGRSGDIRRLGDQILSLRGVKHGRLVITSTGRDLR
jgi:CopG family transcriptional regulator, nickel-responsive regulator